MGEIANDMIEGACCSDCSCYFVKEHGYPVICNDCIGGWSKKEMKDSGLQRSTELLVSEAPKEILKANGWSVK